MFGLSFGHFSTTLLNIIIIISSISISIISSMVALKGLPCGPDAIVQGAVQAPNRKSMKSSLMQTAQNTK